jgi:hypothetical protein
MTSVPSLFSTQAHGLFTEGFDGFWKDLQLGMMPHATCTIFYESDLCPLVGQWPANQLINKIQKIEINYESNLKRIIGINTTYLIKPNDAPVTQSHGVLSSRMESLELTGESSTCQSTHQLLTRTNADDEVISGAFLAVIVDDDGVESPLKRLGFYIYDSATGKISTKGWPPY